MSPLPVARARRLGTVVTTLMMQGFEVPLARMRLTHCATLRCRLHCTWARITGRKVSEHPWPVAVREALIRLGPAFVKIGQILSVRSDLIPPKLVAALHSLQSAVPPVPLPSVLEAVEEALGQPASEYFARFDPEPLAAGSVAQVHRATLTDGTDVVVKIKREGIDALVAQDLEILVWLADRLERHVPESRRYRPRRATEELRRYTLLELDFRNEARVAAEVGARFSTWPRVEVPEVFAATRDVIVMAWVEGFPIDDLDALVANDIDPSELMRLGTEATLAQIFEFGLFHGDPHPGNLHVTPDGRIALLDFGIFGRIDPRLRRDCAMLMWCLAEGDTEQAATWLLHMADLEPGADPGAFRTEVERCFRAWRGRSVDEYGFGRLLYDELTIGARHGVIFPPDMVLLGKALLTLEGVARSVDPGLDISAVAEPFLASLRGQLFDPAQLKRSLARAWPLWWALAERLPVDLVEATDQRLHRRSAAPVPTPAIPQGLVVAGITVLAGAALLVAALPPAIGGWSVPGALLLLPGLWRLWRHGR